jgi:hypothetical protein
MCTRWSKILVEGDIDCEYIVRRLGVVVAGGSNK